MKRLIFLLFVFVITVGKVEAKIGHAGQSDIVKIFASSEKEDNIAKNAFDGNPATRWESEWGVDPTWIAVKLKAKRVIKALKIHWEWAGASVYNIEVSNDGKKWKNVKKIKEGKGDETRVVKFSKPVVAKYIRIVGQERIMTEYGYSIWDVELNPVILDENKKVDIVKATASSVQTKDVPEGMSFSAEMAVDGNGETRWASDREDPQWIMIELQKKSKIRAIKIKWETASAKMYKIQVSNNGKSWKEVAFVENGKSNEVRIISFKPVKAKYIRIYGSERNSQWGYSIWEIEVYK